MPLIAWKDKDLGLKDVCILVAHPNRFIQLNDMVQGSFQQGIWACFV